MGTEKEPERIMSRRIDLRQVGTSLKLKCALFGTILFPVLFFNQSAAYGFTVYYLYKLANFSGGIPFGYGAQLSLDKTTGDVYVIDSSHGGVSIFNDRGMETYQFGEAANLGDIASLAVDKDGNIFTLSYQGGVSSYFIGFCDYRGVLKEKIKVTGLPAEFAIFRPNKILLVDGRLYLVDMEHMFVAQVDKKTGVCLKTWDLNHIMGWDKPNSKGLPYGPGSESAFGFTIDGEGNMYFTIPTAFRAFRVTPDGHVGVFGTGGDGPGKFGVISGIAVDSRGYIYVSDKLRCVVLIFDKNLEFVREFGYRGYGMGGLIVPTDIVIGKDGMLYVAQGGNRGVDAFKMGYDD